MTWMKWLGWIVLLIVLTWAALAAVGSSRWSQATRALEARLEAARTAPAVKRYDARELEGLPPPVQRYFRTVMKEGQPIIAAASVDHTGSFNMGETVDQWKPFTSRQRVVTHRPGFVWDGRVLMLPGQGVRWEAVDDRSARATLVDGTLSLTLLFRFDDQGLIESALADARGRTVRKTIVMTPWEGRWSDYQERDGMRVPMTGEVAWLAPEGRKPYWRGTITSLRYEFVH